MLKELFKNIYLLFEVSDLQCILHFLSIFSARIKFPNKRMHCTHTESSQLFTNIKL
jgi:hypothetical protein